MKKAVVLISAVFALASCLPDGFDSATTAGLTDYWVWENGEITETLDLYYEKGKFRFNWTRQIQGADIVEPVSGTYNVRHSYDYGEKWYVLSLTPDGDEPLTYSYKMTLSFDKRVLTLEGSGVSYYYRVEKAKDEESAAGETEE